jgi:hypothetical protein
MFHEATFVHESVSGSRLCGTSSTTARHIPGMTHARMFNVIEVSPHCGGQCRGTIEITCFVQTLLESRGDCRIDFRLTLLLWRKKNREDALCPRFEDDRCLRS